MANNVCDSPAFKNLIIQRKKLQLYNIPPPRYNNLVNNPYNQTNPSTGLFFTNFDLNMRRKAEVLKYANNTSSTKTNNLTRAQNWAQLVNGKTSSRYSQAYINSNPPPCPDVIVYTPSTASGVPGPSVLLYEDTQIPLYNFTNNVLNAPYGVQNNENNILPWQIYAISDTPSYSIFNTLSIQNSYPENAIYSYSLSIPFTIYVEANVNSSLTGEQHYVDSNAVQIWVSNVSLSVLYSDSSIELNSDINYSLSDVIYDSSETAMNIAADVSINIASTDPAYNKFYAYGYGGVFNISNVLLQGQPGYIYDMKLNIDFIVIPSVSFSTFFGQIPSIYIAYLNTTYDTTQLAPLNCRVTNPTQISPTNFPQFSLTGEEL